MTNIYIARHGQNIDNKNGILNGHRDEPLTDLGRKQAEELGKKIKEKNLRFDVVYTSPLSRAFETAEIVCKTSHQIDPIILDTLIERNFGSMTGIEASRIEELCAPDIIKTETITYFLNPPGSESFPDLLDRAKEILEFIVANHKNQSILLVTHGDIGKMIYAEFYNLPWREVLTNFHFGNSEILYLNLDSDENQRRLFITLQYNH